MNEQVKEIIEKIDSMKDEKGHKLQEYIEKHPAHGQVYIEVKSKNIQINLLQIEQVSLALSYIASINKK